jgi:DNA-binding response OmpR family regulator
MAGRVRTSSSAIWVAGHGDEVRRPDGVASVIADLGAPVRTIDLWREPGDSGGDDAKPARLLLVEVLDRPDFVPRALKSLRRDERLRDVPVLAVIGPRSITQLDPAAGHDDFVVWPAPPAELYARVRQLEWRNSEYADEDVVKLGPLVIHQKTREVSLNGDTASLDDERNGGEGADESQQSRPIPLTAREFALLLALATRRGRVLTRETLLTEVWGSDYDGGAKTVDVHVRRLRAKLGEALPLQTIRGAGYVLR